MSVAVGLFSIIHIKSKNDSINYSWTWWVHCDRHTVRLADSHLWWSSRVSICHLLGLWASAVLPRENVAWVHNVMNIYRCKKALYQSSSSGGMPFKEHSCLHDFLSLTLVLHTLPRRREANVAVGDVQFDWAQASPPSSTGLATPLGWRVDGCHKGMWMVLGCVSMDHVVGMGNNSNKCSSLAVIVEMTGGWLVLCLTSSLVTVLMNY